MSTREVPLDSPQGSAVHRVSALVDELNANEPTLHDLFHDSVSDIPEELSEQPSDSNDQPGPQKKQSKYYRIDPPKEGEPEEFTRPDGTTVYFCKKHNWNLSHGNSDCYAQKSENSELNDKLQKKINPIAGISSIVKEK